MEIVVRSALTFAFLYAVVRVMGKRELSQMSAFELLLLVTMGDLVQQGVTQEDFSLTGSFLAVGTMTLLILAMSFLQWRWPRTRTLLSSEPVVVARRGQPVMEALRHERLSVEDVVEAARAKGIEDLSAIDAVILEPDGRFSFLTSVERQEDDEERRSI